MTKADYIKDIRHVFGDVGLLSERQLKNYLNVGEDSVKTFLLDIPHFGNGRGKRFAVVDISEKLAQNMGFKNTYNRSK